MKRLFILMLLFTMATTIKAQVESQGMLAIEAPSVVCGMCKAAIEKGLAYTKGIKSSRVDIDEKKILVKYHPDKITADEVRQAIASLGYQADTYEADPKAFAGLPACCKSAEHCTDGTNQKH